ncbi:MAG: S1 RNA-binding domain-containing protein [Clostridia bacterium]|nr:S1 RNA-binding domain-containing protein [Clostridia bacterium]
MEYSVGDVLDGKVTGITKFGAFVSIGEGRSGLVHISEIANTFVREVREHLTEGQEVRVKIIGIDEAGRINLSIKKALPPPETAQNAPRTYAPRENTERRGPAEYTPRPQSARSGGPREFNGAAYTQSGDADFEDKLKNFMQDSNSRIADLKLSDRKGSSRRGRQRG